jgi:hypothetical protein
MNFLEKTAFFSQLSRLVFSMKLSSTEPTPNIFTSKSTSTMRCTSRSPRFSTRRLPFTLTLSARRAGVISKR